MPLPYRAMYDLAIVGGGINGAGIARDAAGRGLTTLLVEKDDLASHTSSWSTKLIHGGLRYLEYYEFRLVAESLAEREVLLRAAPHIITPLQFVLPHEPHLHQQMGRRLEEHVPPRLCLRRRARRRRTSGRLQRHLRTRERRGHTYPHQADRGPPPKRSLARDLAGGGRRDAGGRRASARQRRGTVGEAGAGRSQRRAAPGAGTTREGEPHRRPPTSGSFS